MTPKMIKVRLFTWFEETESPVDPNQTVLTERIAHIGEEPDITNETYLKRGEDLDAFFTDDEAEEIRNGTYQGVDADNVYRARGGAFSPGTGLPLEQPALTTGEGDGNGEAAAAMDAVELGQHISDNKLTVQQTVALIPENADEETLQKFEDAENIATDNEPRQGVLNELDKRREAL